MPVPDITLSFESDCFALLDDCDADARNPSSRLYTGHAGTLHCAHAADLPGLLAAMQQALSQGQHAVGLFGYELGADMQGIASREAQPALTQILLFERCEHLRSDQVTAWLDERARLSGSAGQPAGIAAPRASVGADEFDAAIARIHAYIEAGDTYQINYTYRLHFDAYGAPHALYRRLRERQPVPYGALLQLPDGRAVLSLSPELFMRQARGTIVARPMKGTAAASGDAAQDAARGAALAADPKNRAENLMIVDLLRNDLGRIAQFGSVRVPDLFQVTRYNQVLQMTSTVQAQLRTDITLHDIFAALYPCGSITGAPKRRTMQIIRELESTPRGFYTGAIGWFDALDTSSGNGQVGDFCLSVPIRTLVLQAPDVTGVRAGEMGVGAGIVHDSIAADEYAECLLKARFLTGMPHEFELFETLHATREAGCRHLELHLQRLHASAAYFGFAHDESAIRALLLQTSTRLADGPHRLRLALHPDGSCSVQTGALAALQEPVRLLIADRAPQVPTLFLRHKTSVRADYDAAWRAAEAQGAFDTLFFNAEGYLTEGGRSSVFVKLDGRWHTPPLACGLLPGVMRTVVLADPAWHASERTLTRADLDRAEQIMVCNALRGAVRACV